MPASTPQDILVIDVGATSIKSSVINLAGERIQPMRKRKTLRPISPEQLLAVLMERVELDNPEHVVVGLPVECRNGVALDSGNLARGGSVNSDRDEAIGREWRQFPFEQELRSLSGREVVVLNDATLAALGCVTGRGNELVLALGTGFGVALVANGVLKDVEDRGNRPFKEGTYDSLLGEGARRREEDLWRDNLSEAVSQMGAEYNASVVWLVGGNAKRLKPTDFEGLPFPLHIAGNDAPFQGAAKVFGNPKVIGR